jgi:hypothetical protein
MGTIAIIPINGKNCDQSKNQFFVIVSVIFQTTRKQSIFRAFGTTQLFAVAVVRGKKD